MGSKSRIAKYIVPIIQQCINDNNIKYYYEPFVGGANIIDKIVCSKRIGSDNNEFLIDFWNKMQSGLDLNSIAMDSEIYKAIRDNKNCYPKHMVAIAGILASYNSKWFAGYAKTHIIKAHSDKNVIIRNYYQESINNVLKQMPNLTDVKFDCNDYKQSVINIANAMVYCDPPYISTTGFKDGIDHNEYWEWVRNISKYNFVLCSEYNAPNDFNVVWSGEVTITVDNSNRSKATEKLFAYKNGLYAKYLKERAIIK